MTAAWINEGSGMVFTTKPQGRQLPYLEVGMPNLVAYLNWTYVFEWWYGLVRFQERMLKEYVLKEIGLHAFDT
jgi:hypothetical protein